MNVSTACLCVCAPFGHHHGICQSTAEPGLFVTLNRTNASPVRLPACRPCREAVRRQMWAGMPAGVAGGQVVGPHRQPSLRVTA